MPQSAACTALCHKWHRRLQQAVVSSFTQQQRRRGCGSQSSQQALHAARAPQPHPQLPMQPGSAPAAQQTSAAFAAVSPRSSQPQRSAPLPTLALPSHAASSGGGTPPPLWDTPNHCSRQTSLAACPPCRLVSITAKQGQAGNEARPAAAAAAAAAAQQHATAAYLSLWLLFQRHL
ncbi:hypothetical protein ABPG75_001317 [Micractinium tetrahymenae]